MVVPWLMSSGIAMSRRFLRVTRNKGNITAEAKRTAVLKIESTVETERQLQPALLKLSAMISQ